MALILLFSVLLLATGLFFWIPKYRVQRAIARPFPRRYAKILQRNMPLYARLPTDLQLQLKRLIQQFLLQKKFVGCGGLNITTEIKVTIAAKACLLLLNRTTPVYPRLAFVLVYPSAFVVARSEVAAGGLVTQHHHILLGESWDDDRVILAWDQVRRGKPDLEVGHDVVLHEFAHQLDSESGTPNGAPYLASRARYQRWSSIFLQEFALLREAARHQLPSVLDYYGATSPAEFFAVATEAFFEKSAALAQQHPALFAALNEFYCVDPREWQ